MQNRKLFLDWCSSEDHMHPYEYIKPDLSVNLPTLLRNLKPSLQIENQYRILLLARAGFLHISSEPAAVSYRKTTDLCAQCIGHGIRNHILTLQDSFFLCMKNHVVNARQNLLQYMKNADTQACTDILRLAVTRTSMLGALLAHCHKDPELLDLTLHLLTSLADLPTYHD
jgi:hypothetical protein